MVLSSISLGGPPDIIIKGNVDEYREAGPGEHVYQHMEIREDGKKSSPAVTNAGEVTMPAKDMKDLLSGIPTDLLIGELARRGISIDQKGTLNCGGTSSVGHASKKEPIACKGTCRKKPSKLIKKSAKSHQKQMISVNKTHQLI